MGKNKYAVVNVRGSKPIVELEFKTECGVMSYINDKSGSCYVILDLENREIISLSKFRVKFGGGE